MDTVELPAAFQGTVEPNRAAVGILPFLLSISRSTRALVDLKLSEIGIVIGQDSLLLVLSEEEGIFVSRASELIGVRASTVSTMVDRLSRRGLVERDAKVGDMRRTNIRLTAAGAEMRSRVAAVYRDIEAQILKEMGEKLTDVMPALDRMSQLLGERLSWRR